jgi:hypothetical protein
MRLDVKERTHEKEKFNESYVDHCSCGTGGADAFHYALGHDERLHGENAVTGLVVAANADGMELKTRSDTVKVKFSSKTKFEHEKKAVDKSHVKVGDRAGVIGNKLPTGEWMANEVILGLPASNPAGSAKSATKKEGEKKD